MHVIETHKHLHKKDIGQKKDSVGCLSDANFLIAPWLTLILAETVRKSRKKKIHTTLTIFCLSPCPVFPIFLGSHRTRAFTDFHMGMALTSVSLLALWLLVPSSHSLLLLPVLNPTLVARYYFQQIPQFIMTTQWVCNPIHKEPGLPVFNGDNSTVGIR